MADFHLPSQVKNFANLGAFPTTGGDKTIYIAENSKIAYYWTGSAYAPISIQDLSGLVPQTRTINGYDLSVNRTLTASDVGAPSGSGTSTGTNTGDQTFITPRVQSVTSSATVTPTSTNDIVIITAQAVGLTLANPTGTLFEGQSLIIRIKDNGTAQTIAYGTNYRAVGVTAPTTTVISKTTYIGCIYNSTDNKFDIIGICTEV